MSFVTNTFQVDLIKFDDILHRKFGDYEGQGLSMKDIIKREYGDAGINLIEQLI